MSKDSNKKRNKKILAILIALACISIIVISISIGKPKNSIWPFHLELDNPVSYYEGNQNDPNKYLKAVVDQNGKRISLIDSSNSVYFQMYFDSNNDTLSFVQKAIIYNNELYLYGFKSNKTISQIESVKIVKYSLEGKFLEEIVKYDYTDDSYRFVNNMEIQNDTLFISSSQWDNLYITKINLNNKNQIQNWNYHLASELFTTIWYYDENVLIAIDNLNQAYKIKLEDNNNENLKIISNNYTLENNNPYYKVQFCINQNINHQLALTNKNSTNKFDVITGSINWDLKNSKAYICETYSNSIVNYDFNSDSYASISSFRYNPFVLMLNIAYWVSLAYVVFLIIFLIVIWLVYVYKKDEKRFLKISIGLSILIAVSIAFFVAFANFSNWEKKNHETNLESLALIVSQTSKPNIEEFNYNNVTKNANLTQESYNNNIQESKKLISMLEYVCNTGENKTEQNLNYEIFGYDTKLQKFQCLVHMSSYIGNYGLDLAEKNKSDLLKGNIIKGFDDSKIFQTYSVITPLYNTNNKIIGAIILSISYDTILVSSSTLYFNLIIATVLVIIVLFLGSKEWMNFKNSIKNYKHAKKIHFPHAEIFVTGTMDFLRNYIVSLDNVLCVLITKDMLDVFGEGSNGVMLGLPIALYGLGCFLGSSIFSILSKKYKIRSIYVFGTICTLASMILAAITVFIFNFYLFSFVKILIGIFTGILYSANYTLTMCIDDEKLRFKVMRNVTLTDVSAPILSVLFSAIIADLFGYWMIYIVGSIFGLGLLVLSLTFMPKKLKFRSVNPANRLKVDKRTILKFFADPAIICCVLVCIISLCAGAYKSYLFPLYTNGLNLTNTEISNYFIIASAFVFIFSPALDTITKRFNHWNNVISYLIILFVIFVLFLINNTILWAFLAFFLSTIIQKSLNGEWKLLWPRKCTKLHIDAALVEPIFAIIDSAGLCIRPLILGTFLSLGAGNACVALGCACLITAILFYLSSSKSEIRKEI